MEPLGSIAAAIGLADAGLRTLVGIYSIAMDLKDVPKRLRDIHHDLQNFHGFVSEVQRNASQVFAKATPTQLERSEKTLKTIAASAGELTRTLESTLLSLTDSRTQRVWRALVSVSKQKDMLAECERLVRLKQDLQLELQVIGITLAESTGQSLQGVAMSVSLSQLQVNALHPKVDTIHDSVSETVTTVKEIADKMEPLAASLNRVEESSDRIEALAHSLHQLLLSGGSGASLQVATRVEQREAAAACYRKLAEYPTDLQSAADRLSRMETSPFVAAPPRRASPPLGMECCCQTRRDTSFRRIGPVTTRYSSVAFHASTCPLSWSKNSRRDYMICLNMKPFMNRAIQLFHSSIQRRGTWETSRVLRPYRIVSRRDSPAFQLFEELCAAHVKCGTYETILQLARKYDVDMATCFVRSGSSTQITESYSTSTLQYRRSFVDELGTEFVSHWLGSLQKRLHELFTSGAAEPKDTDEFGNTLLHEVVFSWSLISDYGHIFKDQFHELSGYLYDMGADPGAICPIRRDAAWIDNHFTVIFHTSVDGFRPHKNPTVSDLAFYQLLRPEPSKERVPTVEDRCPFPFRIIPSVEMDFYNLGGYAYGRDSNVDFRSRLLAHALRSWNYYNFFVDAGLTPLHEAILSRNTAKVALSIRRFPPADEGSWECELSIVECAIGWPEGLSMLCNAGYSVKLAFEVVILRNDVSSAEVMIESDFPITKHHLRSISKKHNPLGMTELHKRLIDWTVSTLTTRRMELQRLATTKLPARILTELGLVVTRPPDSIAARLVEELESIGISIPSILHATTAPVFHCFSAFTGGSGRLYRLLYGAGFNEIDAWDRSGKTPLDIALGHLFTNRTHHWPLSACKYIVRMIRHGACVTRALHLGGTRVRPLFALACLYSTNYNDKRRWTQWNWGDDEDFLEMLEALKTVGKPGNQYIENVQVRDLLWDLGLKSDGSPIGSSSASYASSYTSRGASAPTVLGESKSSETSFTSGSPPDSDEESGSDATFDPNTSGLRSRFQRAPRGLISVVARRDRNLEDDCECYCSTNGCLPIHMISVLGGYSTIKTWARIQDDVFDWIDDCDASFDQARKYVAAACRLEVFSRLGMAHTCCRMNALFQCSHQSEETKMELREEDSDFNDQLELIMVAFNALLARHKHWPAASIWAQWWRKLDPMLPPLLPWERGLQYCSLPTSGDDLSRLLDLREMRHAVALRRMGYPKNADFLDVIKDHLPGLLNACSEEPTAIRIRRYVIEERVGTWKGRDIRLKTRRIRRRRSF
ncbi:hypothetical protein B0T14DRAFT_207 [Immersiella caudata]|uniref:Fungal N-terminal domain-containing protein n=1 Tax=Immersiella caudata TaxID=314043 RepID=A0AA39XD74_9PEZI|nr:hypothetical protein B0T14DRAFT_207 [Immersiella caudata]